MGWVVVIGLGIVAFLVWQFLASRKALATSIVHSSRSPAEVAQAINSAFGGVRSVLWTDTNGPGMINRRRRGKGGGITISIDIEPVQGGGSEVHMWSSAGTSYFGLFANFAGAVNSRKRAIARLVT